MKIVEHLRERFSLFVAFSDELAEDFPQYLTPAALVDRVENLLVGYKRPDPVLIAVDRKAGFVAVDDVAVTNVRASTSSYAGRSRSATRLVRL